jgi:hypothetical protein
MKVLGYGLVYFDAKADLWLGIYDGEGNVKSWDAIIEHDLELMTDLGFVTLEYDDSFPSTEWSQFTLHVSLASEVGIKGYEVIETIEAYDPGPRKLSYQEIHSKGLDLLVINDCPNKEKMH